MFKKIAALVVVGFVAITQAESSLFSLFKQQASSAPETAVASEEPNFQKLMEMNAESFATDNWSQDTNDIFTLCDSNRSGWITQQEALTCGGQTFWSMIKPFDSNNNNLLTWSEVYNAVKYYHSQSFVELASVGAAQDSTEPFNF